MTRLTRREFALGSLTAGLAIALCPRSNAAPMDPNDPTAKALGFVIDAKKVDPALNPTFKVSQNCASCAQYQGKAVDPSAPCAIFAGKTVPSAGWCKVWAQRSA